MDQSRRRRHMPHGPAVELALLDDDKVMPALTMCEVILGPPVKCDKTLKVWKASVTGSRWHWGHRGDLTLRLQDRGRLVRRLALQSYLWDGFMPIQDQRDWDPFTMQLIVLCGRPATPQATQMFPQGSSETGVVFLRLCLRLRRESWVGLRRPVRVRVCLPVSLGMARGRIDR